MKTLVKNYRAGLCAILTILGLSTAGAQTTANWLGPATGGEWNTGGNWDTGFPPLDATTNAFVGVGTNVSYNLPMIAAGFGILTNNGSVAVNTNGFNCTAIIMNQPTVLKTLWITNSGAAVNISGNLTMGTNCIGTLAAGASLTVGGNFVIAASESSSANNTTTFTNRGGTLTATSTAVNNNTGTGTGLLLITGGTNNLGNTSVGRYHGTSPSTLGTEGLAITGGSVTMSNLSLSGPSYLTGFISGGTVTNYGSVFINGATAGRYSRLFQTGGYFVVPEPGVVNPNSTTAGALTSVYSVTGGTNIVGGFYFGNSNTLVGATAVFTNSAVIYIGSLGISTNGASINTLALNNGGIFGANASWTGNADMLLNGGTFTFQTAAQDGTPQNITLSGALRGSGTLNKTAAGTLTLTATNTYTGGTTINAGTLALSTDPVSGSVGSIASSSPINVGSGATFDVTQAGGMILGSGKTIAGLGTVAGPFAAGPGANVNPAGTGAQGTLNFANGLSITNANLNLELTDDTSGTVKVNDLINITGDLNVGGTNIVVITPVTSLTLGTYKLIKFTGNFNGDATNFACASGTVVANPGEIDLIVAPARAAASLVWRGDGSANLWDAAASTNWLNGATPDRFLPGDTANFDNSSTNQIVTLSGVLSPAATGVVTVNSTSNYTFTGSGDITGSTGLTKTNSGKLTILATNDYTGVTTIAGGILSVSNLAIGGVSSPIGSAGTAASNLVFNGGTLEYLGGNKTIDRSALILAGGGTLNVSNLGVTLTISAALTGPGSLTKIGNGQLSLNTASDYQGGTVITAGTIRAAQGSGSSGNPVNISVFGTNTLTLNGSDSPATLFFGGDVENLNNTLNIVNTNNFITNGGNDQVLNMIGNGLVNLEGTGANVLTFAGDMTAFNGTIYADTLINPRFLPASGSISGGTNVIFNLGTGSAFLNNRNGNLTVLLGGLFGGPNTLAEGDSSVDNRLTTYIIGGNNSNSEFDGKFTEVSSIRKVALVKAGTGTFTLTQPSSYSAFTTISNGVLALAFNPSTSTDGSIDSTTNIEITANGILDVSARSDGALTVGGSQTLRGSGTIRGSLNVSGLLAPDGGTPDTTLGTLTVTNVVNLGNLTSMKLNRSGSPNSDRLVAPTINLGGSLVITTIGAPLKSGDTFTLFSGTLANSFGGITLPNYYTFDTTQLTAGGNGTITVTSYTPPVMTADYTAFSTGTITFNITGGIPGNGVSVLTSTNVASPIASWTAAATGNFDGSGNFSAPVTVDPSIRNQYFLMATQ